MSDLPEGLPRQSPPEEPDNEPVRTAGDADGTPAPAPVPAKAKRPRKGPPLNPREQMARAEVVMAKRLARLPIDQVCRDLNMSRATYYRALTQARKTDLYAQARDVLLEDLMPRALRVYAIALEANDIEVARDILNGLGLLGKHTSLTVAPGGEPGDSVTFERWRMQRGGSASAGPIIDADPQPPHDQGLLAAAVEGDAESITGVEGDGPAPPAPPGEGVPEDRVDREGLRGDAVGVTITRPNGESHD